MPESKSSAEPAKPADHSPIYFGAGILVMALGAGLFHPGAGLMLAGAAIAYLGLAGAPRKP